MLTCLSRGAGAVPVPAAATLAMTVARVVLRTVMLNLDAMLLLEVILQHKSHDLGV